MRTSERRSVALATALLLLTAFLWLYLRTGAPSVLSGDSAEFQFAAPLLAVPHPTGYPLYVVLGYLASRIPGDAARRVTQVSAACAALCVALALLLVRRLSGSLAAALLAALALGLSPGLWNAATLAEVYALNALLITALALSVARGAARPCHANGQVRWWSLALSGLLAGLGISHHSSFLFSAAPLVAIQAVAALRHRPAADAQPGCHTGGRILAPLAAGGLLGLTPWLFPLIQYARYGPFNGWDHGLPTFYFWGAPRTWGEALAHLAGGDLGGDAARWPSVSDLVSTTRLIGERLWFEFGPTGLTLGCLGCVTLWRRNCVVWLGSCWVVLGTAAFIALLGPDVQDAPVFTLPIMLSWSLWIGCGGLALALAARSAQTYLAGEPEVSRRWIGWLVLSCCLALTLWWGQTRRIYADKSELWLFRSYGEEVLGLLSPDAAVIVSWEQGTIFYYLTMVERQRPDVIVDIVEPGDEPWAERALRYPGRQVYFIGTPAFFPGAQVRELWLNQYGSLYLFEGRTEDRVATHHPASR